MINLPDQGSKPSEIDIEGLDVADGCVWLVGSHSRKRKKPKGIGRQRRTAIGLPQLWGWEPVYASRVLLDDRQEPTRAFGTAHARRLAGDESGNILTTALRADPHIGPFCEIPSKDDGLDMEGLEEGKGSGPKQLGKAGPAADTDIEQGKGSGPTGAKRLGGGGPVGEKSSFGPGLG